MPYALCLLWTLACDHAEQKPDEKPTQSSSAAAAPPPDAAPAPTTSPQPEPKPPVASPPAPQPVPAAAPSKDGIDDDNWLPKSGTARDTFLSAVEIARSDPAAAVPRFVEAANKASYFYAAWYNAGAAAEAARDHATAERHYKQALVVRPDYGPALANLAAMYQRMGRSAEAQKIVDDALRRFPERAGPHLAAATNAWLKREYAAAEREALLAVRYDERSVPAMLLLAKVYRTQGRLDTARFALENASRVEEGNAIVRLELAHVLLEQGEEKAALLEFERAARLMPTLAEAQENYGVLLLKQGYAQEAVRAFEAAARLEPRAARAHLHLGNGLRAQKNYAGAEAAYKKALELDPNLLEARFNLGVLYIDNALPGVDEVARLQQGVAELREYKNRARPDGALLSRLDDYIDSTDKRIQKEIKRRERDERRKREDEQKAQNPGASAAVDKKGGG